ncbi:MAG TPA: arsenic resistance N-acetyltransferase ArsN2, partial [Polyangiaceae bacterium]|nr:arsenic resistance N-acetyltransferase ArsN2 [Polyangiaceae bacterium]
SKSVSTIDASSVGTVITLCAEEVCPAFLGQARRLHWPIPDPASKDPSTPRDEMLTRFRTARDTLLAKLETFVADAGVMDTLVSPARQDDLAAVRTLVVAADLPDHDLSAHFPQGYVVARAGGALVGVAGLEVHGEGGLLRSVAVAPTHRSRGVAQALVADRLKAAEGLGLLGVYLLTTTAPAYFVRLGFAQIPRDSAPDALKRSSEFASVCPASAVCMVHRFERAASIR